MGKKPISSKTVVENAASASETQLNLESHVPWYYFPFFGTIFYFARHVQELELQTLIGFYIVLGIGGFLVNFALIPTFARSLFKVGLFGEDINKRTPVKQGPLIPESLGLPTGGVWLVCFVLVQLVQYSLHITNVSLGEYNAAVTSVCAMVLLGFVDDVVDLRWRVKLVLPIFATLPLLLAYSAGTSVVLPRLLVSALDFLPRVVELGLFYKVYMGLFAIFSTNTINIYAGINGLEVGQTVMIAIAVVVHNLIELSGPYRGDHIFSLSVMLPFLGVCFALACYNTYPSRVFVGDTFTYFAGMTFAVAGILGHFSKTMLLMLIPQILNFLISLPQILGVFGPCPRHRLPRYNPETGKLEGVRTNHNLVNVVLRLTGPLTEGQLERVLVVSQAVVCALALLGRYFGAAMLYGDHYNW